MTSLRRLFWLSALGAAGFAAWSWWQRDRASTPAAVPEWPPLDEPLESDDGSTPVGDTAATHPAEDPSPTIDTDMSDRFRGEPPAEPVEGRWVRPVDGECPEGYPVKANGSSMIYHVPGGRFYDRTVPERCYSSPDLAAADGYRAAKA